jgi:hypothetical protein
MKQPTFLLLHCLLVATWALARTQSQYGKNAHHRHSVRALDRKRTSVASNGTLSESVVSPSAKQVGNGTAPGISLSSTIAESLPSSSRLAGSSKFS